jgi:hypothetical protein
MCIYCRKERLTKILVPNLYPHNNVLDNKFNGQKFEGELFTQIKLSGHGRIGIIFCTFTNLKQREIVEFMKINKIKQLVMFTTKCKENLFQKLVDITFSTLSGINTDSLDIILATGSTRNSNYNIYENSCILFNNIIKQNLNFKCLGYQKNNSPLSLTSKSYHFNLIDYELP